MSLLNSHFILPSPIVLSDVPRAYGVGNQYYTQPTDDCSCGASKSVCSPDSQESVVNAESLD